MEMKNKLKIIITSLLPALFLIPSVHAFQLFPPFISETLQNWFGGAIPQDYVTRILLGLLIFIVFYYAAGFAFKESDAYGAKKTNTFRWMIALLIAILTVLFIPQSLLDIYKSMFALITPVLLTFCLIALARKINKHHTQEGHLGAAFSYAVGIAIIGFVVAEASQYGIDNANIFGWSFKDILQMMMAILFALFFINLFKAFGGGSKARLGNLGANIKNTERDAERDNKDLRKKLEEEEKELGKERADTKKEKRIERKEVSEDIYIFKELKELRTLVEEWGKTITTDNPKGSLKEREKILTKIDEIRRNEAVRDRLQQISVKELHEMDKLVAETGDYGRNLKKKERGLHGLIEEEASLTVFFEKLLNYLVYIIDSVPNPKPQFIIGVIDKALAVKAKTVRVEEYEVKDDKQEIAEEGKDKKTIDESMSMMR